MSTLNLLSPAKGQISQRHPYNLVQLETHGPHRDSSAIFM